ncbi:hypothetical protein Phum_PHUM362040 [Pediculus humanus corporis]|uniref:BTB domain-containing protein n=1 Tax=Pediculus humanus subsp. corporis TaxID=121224 RepID=E0VPN5_PEDHC|nr:uncharacterized protein Phum_PHUM362040 [Pediculus humanus corporis]EEB15341.1 hypothetical protein Phum_PHUM362040 [Pediculus humanus corporis]
MSQSQEKSINNSCSFADEDREDSSKHFMNDDIIVENILTPTVTIESDPESSSPNVSMNITTERDANMSLQIKSQVSAQQYCLRWKYHHSNLQVMFIQLLQRESFCDVTLACEGKMLRAHKVVLSACSTYFDKIFSEHEEKDPVVILKDVKFVDIKALVEFMYKGEINVENSHLTSLLKTAEELKIKGLADVSGKTIPKDDDDDDDAEENDSITFGSSSLALQSRDDERSNDVKHAAAEQIGDYDDMFTPTIVEGAHSINEGSDNEDENMEKKDEEMEDANEYMDSANEQSFSTLITQLSDHPLQDFQNDDNNERNSEHDNSETTSNLALQFPDVIKMNDYLTTGRRQQFWEEPFTRRLMEAIKNKEIEMKAAAELMGVSYGTLYGRYRDAYGCLKHPYRTKEFWAEQGPADILAKLQKKEITLFRAAEMLNVTVTTLANYLTTLRHEKENKNENEENHEKEESEDNVEEEDDEEMDVNDSLDVFDENKPIPSKDAQQSNNNNNNNNNNSSMMNAEDEDEDSRSTSTMLDRSDEDYP